MIFFEQNLLKRICGDIHERNLLALAPGIWCVALKKIVCSGEQNVGKPIFIKWNALAMQIPMLREKILIAAYSAFIAF